MLAISLLINKLANNHPEFTFERGDYAYWSAESSTVYYNPDEPHASWVILHEAAHGILAHREYSRDIELLGLERQAWNYAVQTLGPIYGIKIDKSFVEQQLDTYRDWLHAKSTCPACQSNGFEHSKSNYRCAHCGNLWHVNTGVDVAVRRYQII